MAGNYGDPLVIAAAPSGFSATEFNKLGYFIGTPGIVTPNDLTPSGSGTTMSFTAGRCVIEGDDVANQGRYLCPLNGVQTHTLSAGAASSGHERTDWLIAKVYDDPVSGSVAGGSDEWKIIDVPGTEAAVGASVAPSLSTVTSYIPIAKAKVGSSGIISVTDQRLQSWHPSLLDAAGNVRFPDKTTANEVISGSKKFTGGLQRGASGRIRGYDHLVMTRVSTYTLPNINIATDNFTVVKFNFVNASAIDDGLSYDQATGILTLDGGYALSGMVSVKAPSGFGGVRLVTGTGVVVYQLVLSDDNTPFDFISLPFNWSGDYVGTMTIQAGQQSTAAQTQPVNDNSNNPVRLEVTGLC